jgi:hypothetical protein
MVFFLYLLLIVFLGTAISIAGEKMADGFPPDLLCPKEAYCV